MKRCLITGATGVVGPSVADAFRKAGYRVRVLARRADGDRGFPDDFEVVMGDLLEASLSAATQSVDVVIHLAARLHNPESTVDDYERVNVEGTRRLLGAAMESGVSRFIYASTIAVYGPTNGRVIDESIRPAPDTPYARSKRRAEELVVGATRRGVPLGGVLRLASVYGQNMKGNYRRLVDAVRKHRYIRVGTGENRRTLVHELDVGRAFLCAAESDGMLGSVFNVTDGHFHTLNEIIAEIAAALESRPPHFRIPVAVGQTLAAMVDAILPSAHAKAALRKYLEDMAVDGERFRRCTGFVPRIDLSTGWEIAIHGMPDGRNL